MTAAAMADRSKAGQPPKFQPWFGSTRIVHRSFLLPGFPLFRFGRQQAEWSDFLPLPALLLFARESFVPALPGAAGQSHVQKKESMKLNKWFAFIDEGSSEERVRGEYQQLPDKHLAAIDPGVLTDIGLRCYREEVARRAARDRNIKQSQKLLEVK